MASAEIMAGMHAAGYRRIQAFPGVMFLSRLCLYGYIYAQHVPRDVLRCAFAMGGLPAPSGWGIAQVGRGTRQEHPREGNRVTGGDEVGRGGADSAGAGPPKSIDKPQTCDLLRQTLLLILQHTVVLQHRWAAASADTTDYPSKIQASREQPNLRCQ